jgi:ABC-type iron transport system FetAB ATPase subunit
LEVAADFQRGDGRVSAEVLQVAQQGYQLARNAEGTIRETRGEGQIVTLIRALQLDPQVLLLDASGLR